MRSETVITNTKHPVLENTSTMLLLATACFHRLMHAALTVLRWQVYIGILSDLCFVLIIFKRKKPRQAILTIFLKYDLQCTFTKEQR